MVDMKRHGYYVEEEYFDTRIAHARARARYLANTFGRDVPIALHDVTGNRIIATYKVGGDVENVTPGGKDGSKPDA